MARMIRSCRERSRNFSPDCASAGDAAGAHQACSWIEGHCRSSGPQVCGFQGEMEITAFVSLSLIRMAFFTTRAHALDSGEAGSCFSG